MTRIYSAFANPNIRSLLNQLIDRSTVPALYQQTMIQLGVNLGDVILDQIDDSASVYLASTVEDADFLSRGILERLEEKLESVAFACFWNQRFSPFEVEDLQIAPILRKYQEPSNQKINYLVVVKSIISSACVVKTNLIDLIQKVEPEKIFIVAPVIHSQSEEKLKREFNSEIHNKFQFIYFAQDDEYSSDGEIVPGIGGMIYERLGFEDQDTKNRYTPQLVKNRRGKLVSI
ncbi:MAG: hypothetical protein HC852_13065 [Acaryochloridaceae cyanobacterium RU_4_10]|nr:hypothetical protein [Acaryochloridaceae cyanobacterium RU_4_10]